MHSLNDSALESNKYMKINFNGGDLSSDAGLLLVKEFACKLGFDKILKSGFKTNDPVLTAVLGKEVLASQPTLSRFFNRMDDSTLRQFQDIMRRLRRVVYAVKKPQMILLDLDSTLLDTYGHQEGEGFNFHYQSHGYHPLVCYDGVTGDLRDGTDHSCTGVTDFLQPLLDEFLTGYPEIPLLLRGDSGFATPALYKQCETNGTSYVIRLKENCSLRKLAADIEDHLSELTKNDKVSYAVAYGEFMYQAGSWDYPRRVVCKVEKQAGQLVHMFTFIVTNMDSSPEELIHFFTAKEEPWKTLSKRGKMVLILQQ